MRTKRSRARSSLVGLSIFVLLSCFNCLLNCTISVFVSEKTSIRRRIHPAFSPPLKPEPGSCRPQALLTHSSYSAQESYLASRPRFNFPSGTLVFLVARPLESRFVWALQSVAFHRSSLLNVAEREVERHLASSPRIECKLLAMSGVGSWDWLR